MVMERVFEGLEHLDPDDILDRVLCLHPQLVVGPGRGVGVQDEAGGTDLLDMTAATTLSLPPACPFPRPRLCGRFHDNSLMLGSCASLIID
jgi:hypothetical protein